MKPVVAIVSRLPVDGPGGIESSVRELLPRLRGLRAEWAVEPVHAFERMTRWNHIPLLGDLIAGAIVAWKTRDADAVLVNGAEYAWPRMLDGARRDRTIVVWHGTRVAEVPALVPRMNLPIRIYRWLETKLQALALRAPVQLAVSPSAAAEVRACYGDVRVRVILNGGPQFRGAVRRRTCDGETFRILWIGTNAYKKGLDVALAAFSRARELGLRAEIDVIGIGPAGRRAERDVRYHGILRHDAVEEALRRADVLLASTRYEACSVAILEAMAFRLPVVGSKIVSWMFGEDGYEAALDPESFSEAIRAVAYDRVEATARAERAVARLEAFDWDRAAMAYAEEVDRLLERSRSA